MRVQHPRFKVRTSTFLLLARKPHLAGVFCPNQLHEIYLIIWTLHGVRAFVFSAPLLHVHAPHVASATKPINSHVISFDFDGGQGSPGLPIRQYARIGLSGQPFVITRSCFC
jgi:hypothetical protein